MSEIKRTGSPTPQHVKGRTFTWTAPLNAMPPKAWVELFTKTKDRSIDCSPDRVRFYQATLIFDSDEAHVPVWIGFIDGWMASANERFAKWEEEQQLQQKAKDEEQLDPAERLRRAAEKFKNL